MAKNEFVDGFIVGSVANAIVSLVAGFAIGAIIAKGKESGFPFN